MTVNDEWAEREIEIERDNLKLLRKLEEIKRKGDMTGQKNPDVKYVKPTHEIQRGLHMLNDEKRYSRARFLSTQNMKLQKTLKDAPSSISAAKLSHEYQKNKIYSKLQQKTEGGKRNIVVGGF